MLAVLALVISGAGSNHSILTGHDQSTEMTDKATSDVLLVAGPPDPDEASEEMSPDGKPTSEQPARLIFSALSKDSNPNDRLEDIRGISILSTLSLSDEKYSHLVSTSTCLISSRLGRQFTLVGAHPSGTG